MKKRTTAPLDSTNGRSAALLGLTCTDEVVALVSNSNSERELFGGGTLAVSEKWHDIVS
jgi:hypothetical protein